MVNDETFWIITENEEKECSFKAIPIKGKNMTRVCLDVIMMDPEEDFIVVAKESVRIGKMEQSGEQG